MKKIGMLLSLAFLGFVVSCSTPEDLSPGNAASTGAQVVLNGDVSNARMPSSTVEIVQTPSGEYVSSYGGGVSFGTSFIHPTTVDPTGDTDGQPIVEYEFVTLQSPTTTISSMQHGAHFVLIQPTFGAPPSASQLQQYLTDLALYWDWVNTGATGPGVTHPTPLGTQGGGGGVIEVRGQVVRDHNSPTNASVVDENYVYVSPGVFLCILTKNSRRLRFYVPSIQSSGTVTKVTATDLSNNPLSVGSFSVNYTFDGDWYHVTGSVTVSGTSISINDNCPAP